MLPTDTTPLAEVADRTTRLYTPCRTAMEVLRLTDEPRVDARALCDCLEADPALAAKLLRVVNSSLYGMPHEVASLSQAIALLGVQPLKMLVLGFATPEGLVAEQTDEALRRYWTETLTTATAARLLGDLSGRASIGGGGLAPALVQGVGQLALLGQLGDDYAELLKATRGAPPIVPPRPLEPVEREALGFTHRALSAELARRWRLPTRLFAAIDAQASHDSPDPSAPDEALIASVLRVANLVTRLVVQRDLAVLADLMDAAQECLGLSQRQINAVVQQLQQRTLQMAAAMATPLEDTADYQQVLIEAHARLSLLSERSAVQQLGQSRTTDEMDEDEQLLTEMLTETNRLSAAMRAFLAGGQRPETPADDSGDDDRAQPRRPHTLPKPSDAVRMQLVAKTADLVAACRDQREPLSLVLFQAVAEDATADASVVAIKKWLGESPWAGELERATWAPLTRNRTAVWMPGAERLDANRLWRRIGETLSAATPLRLDVGVAGVRQISRAFEAEGLVAAAERCFETALASAGPTIKGIEVF